jgi:truncated hemoglobin YjbI
MTIEMKSFAISTLDDIAEDFYEKMGTYEAEIERYYDHMLADAAWRALFSSKNEFEQ